MSEAILQVTDLTAVRGASPVVFDVSFQVNAGDAVALLGPNGAGKSSTVDAVAGLADKRGGKVVFQGQDITGLEPYQIVRVGMSQVSKDRDLFTEMSVRDNLLLGRIALGRRKGRKDQLDVVLDLFPRLRDRIEQQAGTLSGGEQQMLAIGRALMGEPSLLLLDEPSSGLAPSVVAQVMELVEQLSVSGLTIMLIEQDVDLALRVCNRVLVMRHGRVAFDGPKEQLGPDPRGAISQLFAGLPVTTTEAS
jgi:branched-chain amino acid transport system ATP-binding protein